MSQPEPRPLQAVLNEICQLLQRGQNYHSRKAQEYGEAKDIFRGFEELTHKVNEEAFSQFIPGFDKFRIFLKAREQMHQIHLDVRSSTYAIVSTSAGFSDVATMPSVRQFVETYLNPPKTWTIQGSEDYARRLEKLDPELARIYRGIGETFWGSTENPERSAFSLARQAFDHLFHVLAPDDKVRESEHFATRTEGDEKKVTRLERIHYAADTHIMDQAQKEFLVQQATCIVDRYNELNRLHARESLDRQQARQILQAMVLFFNEWIDALGL